MIACLMLLKKTKLISVSDASKILSVKKPANLLKHLVKKKTSVFSKHPKHGQLTQILVCHDLDVINPNKINIGFYCDIHELQNLKRSLKKEYAEANAQKLQILAAKNLLDQLPTIQKERLNKFINKSPTFITPAIDRLGTSNLKYIYFSKNVFEEMYGKYKNRIQINQRKQTFVVNGAVYSFTYPAFMILFAIYELSKAGATIRRRDIEAWISIKEGTDSKLKKVLTDKGIRNHFLFRKSTETLQANFWRQFIVFNKNTRSYSFNMININKIKDLMS